jgi:hypothetical protein
MQTAIDAETIRVALLEVIQQYNTPGPQFQSTSTLNEVARKLGFLGDLEKEQLLLTLWHDLFRLGHVAWGYNVANADPPFCHLTEMGRKALQQFSRDPMNPDGYISHLRSKAYLSAIPQSYIEEALRTYNSGCHRATAVMVGCASEAISLELRDAMVDKMTKLGRSIPKDLQDWRIKKVLGALNSEIEKQSSSMPTSLKESFESYWPAFTQQIRAARNDAGHPSSIDPVTTETVHASLLIFPELADLSARLNQWIVNSFS